MFLFDALLQLRKNTLKSVETLSTEQLNKIPEGHNNNIIWHIGHMMASQQHLCYGISGATPQVSQDFIAKYRKGTSPKGWTEPVSLDEIKSLFLNTAEIFEKDYTAKKFNSYETYTTSAGVVLSNIEDAITYSYGHENLHYGNILIMRKLV
ncbi:MAG TPA: DinB family protein [Cytophagaceae bacterium]|nr:DinB family protein [Cytophagaceae bacterium]